MKKFHFFISLLLFLFSAKMPAQIKNMGYDLEKFSHNYTSLPLIDLDQENRLQAEVDRESGRYLGHPSTVLLEDGKTIVCVYPQGHGRGPILMKRSHDGGLTWSERQETPASWASSLETPTIFSLEDPTGKKRLFLFSGLYPARMSISEDNGYTWSDLKTIDDWGGIVLMGDILPLNTGKGHYMAMFHDDHRFFSKDGRDIAEQAKSGNNQPLFTIYKTFTYDGGLHWSFPQEVYSSRIIHLCEPGMIRSPDGKQIAVLLRENARRMNSHIIFSDDEGKNWTTPRQLPNALSGDRHQAIYTHDGRLFISFRDTSPAFWRYNTLKVQCKDCDDDILHEQAGPVSPTLGDWVAWVGTYDDLVEGRQGQYRIRMKDNSKDSDCAYPALELLPDGTIVATTYGHWQEKQEPYILCLRFNIQEIDWLKKQKGF